jgi:hypothetical protein
MWNNTPREAVNKSGRWVVVQFENEPRFPE